MVIAVTMILAAILMPALRGVQDHAERVVSASNMRQVGMGMAMYSTDNMQRLPASALLRHSDPDLMQEMMATHLGLENATIPLDEIRVRMVLEGNRGWEGIGLLYAQGYTDSPGIFYCPSHRGDHPAQRYEDQYDDRDQTKAIYSNYHYRGDVDRATNRVLTLDRDAARVFLTDGMRTKRDFNHRIGFHSLLGDGSVYWRVDVGGEIYHLLPDGVIYGPPASVGVRDLYSRVWGLLDGEL